jgi:outer membrane protein assembly factor BamB
MLAQDDEGGQRNWPQWGQNAQHQGISDATGQALNAQRADIVYDRFVPLEQQDNGGDLLAHYQAPLVVGNDVYMEFKSGRYVACDPTTGNPPPGETVCGSDSWPLQIWNERRLHWEGGALKQDWNYASDWKPVPDQGLLGGWEPVFHATVSGDIIYVPGFGGTIWKIDRHEGTVLGHISPFATLGVDPGLLFETGPPVADSRGNLYYNVIQLADVTFPVNIIGPAHGYLVKVAAPLDDTDLSDDNTRTSFVSFETLLPEAPLRCLRSFANDGAAAPLPWPPTPTQVPSTGTCGNQRPGVNAGPAVAPDGTVYVVSKAHRNSFYSYLVAVNPDLTRKWASSLRDRLNTGCGVLVPIGTTVTTPNACRIGTPADGRDPATNRPGAGRVIDQSSSVPTVMPNGDVLYGAYTRYNVARGHLMQFHSDGAYAGAYDFGWDSTPAASDQGKIVIKDNHYDAGRYCNTFDPSPNAATICPALPQGPYYITELNSDLSVAWRFRNTETNSCSRRPDGTITCVPNTHPNGFEWCINAPAIDARGVVYANSEDGNIYAINPDGTFNQRFFLNLAIGAAYTPLAIGPNGLIYTENDGRLFVVSEDGSEISQGGGHDGTQRNGTRRAGAPEDAR